MSFRTTVLQRLAVFNPIHLEVVNESAGHGGYFCQAKNPILKW